MGLLVVVVVALAACQDDHAGLTELDLLDKGFPVTIMAPDSAKVKVTNLGFIQDITVEGEREDNYSIQIYAEQANTNDVALLKSRQMEEVKSNRLFARVVEEDEKGFIYELRIDSKPFFGFRYVHIQGDQAFVFMPGLSTTYSEEQARDLYKAVQQKG